MRTRFPGTSRTIVGGRRSSSDLGSTISHGFLNRVLNNSNPNRRTIEQLDEVIDIDHNLRVHNNHQLSLLNPRVLYDIRITNWNTTLVKSTREEALRVTDNDNIVVINLFDNQTIESLKQTRKMFVHTGLIVIGIKGLTRKNIGTQILTLVLDQAWENDVKK